jgi:hypothetical protein
MLWKQPSLWREEMEWALPPWIFWTAVAVGVAFAGMVFWLGWTLWIRRRTRLRQLAGTPRHWKEDASPQDAFRYGLGMARRRSVRLSGNQIPVLVSLDHSKKDPLEGWVINRSQGGLRLTLAQALPVGTIMEVRAMLAQDEIPWVQVEIKNCREKGQSWELGCEFVGDPSQEVLASFGST